MAEYLSSLQEAWVHSFFSITEKGTERKRANVKILWCGLKVFRSKHLVFRNQGDHIYLIPALKRQKHKDALRGPVSKEDWGGWFQRSED